MLRIVLGLLAGYFGMAVVVLLWAFVAVLLIWPELRPGPNWEMKYPPLDHPAFFVELPVNVVAALIGGVVLALVARERKWYSLFWLCLVLLPMSLLDALAKLETKPLWGSLSAPFLAMFGLIFGASLVRIDAGRLQMREAFKRSREFAAPIERVFAVLTDYRNIEKILNDVVKVEPLDSGAMRLGSRFRETRLMNGREGSAVITISAFEPPRRYAGTSSMVGLTATYDYVLEPVGEGCRVTLTCLMHANNPLAWLMAKQVATMMEKSDANHLDKVAALVEAPASA